MNRIVELINGEQVALIIGLETKLFFKRYVALKKIGIVEVVDHAEKFSALAGDDEAFSKQVAIIVEQTGVSRDIATGGCCSSVQTSGCHASTPNIALAELNHW
jgi:hypothetical protein